MRRTGWSPLSALWQGLALLCITTSLWATACAQSPLPTVQTTTLANGHRLYVVENHLQPVVTLDTWVDVGSVNETPPVNGLSHFLEHLLFKGTPQWPTGSIDRWLDGKGASYNAATSQDFTHYHITIASPFFQQALSLHAQMLQQSNFPADELDRERLVVQEEINRARNNPSHRLFDSLQGLLYAGHPYAQTTLGPKTVIANVPRQRIIDYWCQWYQPEHFQTVIVGDVTLPQAVAAVQSAFNQAPSSCSPRSVDAVEFSVGDVGRPNKVQVSLVEDPGVSQVYGLLAMPAPPARNWQASVALDAATKALGGGPSSRLYQRLRNKEQIVRSIGAGNLTQRHGGALYVSFETSPDQVETVIAEVLEEMARLSRDGITAQELAGYQQATRKAFIAQSEKTEDLAETIGYNVTLSSLDDYTQYLARLEALTPAKVREVFRQWYRPGQAVLSAVVPPQSKLDEAGLKSQLAAASFVPLQSTSSVAQPSASSATVPTASPIAARVEAASLPNGIQWVVKTLPGARTVSLQVVWKGGLRAEGQPGLAGLMARALEAGPATRTEADWQRYLEDNGLSINVSAGSDAWTLEATATAEDAGELLLAVDELLTHPAFAPDVIAREQSLMTKDIAANRDQPLPLAIQQATEALYGAHPYGHVGDRLLKSLPTLTAAQVKQFYQQSWKPGAVTAIWAGATDALSARTLVSQWPTLPSDKKAKPQAPPLSLLPSKPASLTPTTRKPEQAATWIVESWPMPPATSPDYGPLKVLNTLLGTGMSSRLFVELREKQGLAYAVGSQYGGTYDPGQLVLYIGTDPKNEAAVLKGFAQQIERLRKGDITEEEVASARDQLIGRFALSHETPADQARYLGQFEAMGLGYAFDAQFASVIGRVTRADVVRVAQQYLAKDPVISLVGPTVDKR